MSRVAALLLVPLTLVLGPSARADTDWSTLSKELAQTLASQFTITLQNYYIASRWNRPGSANAVNVRTIVPFDFLGQENLMRIDIPFRTVSELGPGLSDVRLFDLLTFGFSGGFWGLGPILNLGINKGPTTDTLQAGPVATFVVTSIPRLSVGLLNQNFFSGQVAITTVQPILVYQPTELVTIGLGELPLAYDWNKGQLSVIALGVQLGVLLKAGSQGIRLFVNPEFNTKSSTQLYQWTVTSGVTMQVSPVSPR